MNCTTIADGRRTQTAKSNHGKSPKQSRNGLVPILVVPVEKLRPSPENNDLYKPVNSEDEEIIELAQSIKCHGVQEPLVVTADYFVVSGHRRLSAARLAGLAEVPCRKLDFNKDDDHDRFMQLLRECNRQRTKSYDEKLREEVVSANPEEAYQSLVAHRMAKAEETSGLIGIELRDRKPRSALSDAREPLLQAVQSVIEERRRFWPLSDRQIHYGLLNAPPLIHASKPESVYSNTAQSYKALTDVLTRARLEGIIPMHAIADQTRPVEVWNVHQDVQTFVRGEIDGFLKGYWRNLMQSQPNHIEIVGEKNTILPVIRPVAAKFTIPMTIGRGYCSLPPRYEIAERFRKSGKERLKLLILSDFDPDGQEIAHSLARSLRDDFGVVNVDAIQAALTSDQVTTFRLVPNLQAKQTSSNYRRFAEKYGDDVFELEALAPEDLQRLLCDAIDAVIDTEAFNHEIDAEKNDAASLEGTRRRVHHFFTGTAHSTGAMGV